MTFVDCVGVKLFREPTTQLTTRNGKKHTHVRRKKYHHVPDSTTRVTTAWHDTADGNPAQMSRCTVVVYLACKMLYDCLIWSILTLAGWASVCVSSSTVVCLRKAQIVKKYVACTPLKRTAGRDASVNYELRKLNCTFNITPLGIGSTWMYLYLVYRKSSRSRRRRQTFWLHPNGVHAMRRDMQWAVCAHELWERFSQLTFTAARFDCQCRFSVRVNLFDRNTRQSSWRWCPPHSSASAHSSIHVCAAKCLFMGVDVDGPGVDANTRNSIMKI